jgi:TPR repeat protein
MNRVLSILIISIALFSCSKSEYEIKSDKHIQASSTLFKKDDASKHRDAFNYLYSEYKDGSAYSAGKLGWAYQKGLGVKPDLDKAIELYEFAASRGMTYWQYLLAHAYDQGYLGFDVNPEKRDYWLNQSYKVHIAKYECWVVSYYAMGIYPSNPTLEKFYEQQCNDS